MHVAEAFAGVAHALQDDPHVATLALLTHAPPQRWNPEMQTNPQIPVVHVAVEFAGALQTVAHAPQWFGSELVAISQPSTALPLQSV